MIDKAGLSVDIASFISKCKRAVSRATAQRLEAQTLYAGARMFCDLRLQDELITDGQLDPLPVIPLIVHGSDGLLWLSVRLSFKPRLEKLTHAQIRVLSGERTGNKTCLLRVEWDPRELSTSSLEKDHGQPHWQIDPAIAPTTFAGFQLDETRQSVAPRLRYYSNVDLIHLAMATTFHLKSSGSRVSSADTTPEAVARWLERSVAYVLSQLRYVTKKVPK